MGFGSDIPFLLIFLLFHSHSLSIFDAQYEREEHFDNIDATLLWSLNERTHEVEFVVDVPLSDNGWIGAGISEFGSMKGLDAWIYSEGELKDYWITDFPHDQSLHQDLVQNVKLLGFETRDGRSRVHFVRKILTCDYEDLDIKAFEEWFVIAYGEGPVAYHGENRQSKLINLLFMEKEIYYNDNEGSELRELVFSDNFELKGGIKTQYHYSYLHIDDLGVSNLHVTEFQPMLDTSHYMHHMTLYACPGYDSIPLLQNIVLVDGEYDGDFNMNECELFLIIASERFQIPPNTGLPLGNTAIWLLEIHFEYSGSESQTVKAGITTFLDSPRKHPISITSTHAVFNSLYIPPKATKTITYTVPASLISEKIEDSPITVLLSVGHMHLIGVSFLAEQIRDDKVIRLLVNQKSYDFDRQVPQRLLATIIKGDEIRVSCTYTNPNDHAVSGGEGTDSEMCTLVFAHIGSGSSWKVSFCDPVSGLCNAVNTQSFKTGSVSLDMDADYATFGPAVFQNPSALSESSESFCELSVRDTSNLKRMSPISFGSYESCATVLSLFILGFMIDHIFRRFSLTKNMYNSFSISKQRKRVVYLVNIIIGIVMLVLLLQDLQPLLSFEYKAYDVPQLIGIQWCVYLLEALYMWELCFRINVRPEIIAHHVLTIFITEYLIAAGRSDLNFLYYLQLGWFLQIQIPLEIPAFIALSLKDYTNIISNKTSGYFFWICSLWNFISKILVLVFSMVMWAQVLDGKGEELVRLSFSEWKGSPLFTSVNKFGIPCALGCLFFVQILHCKILFGIGYKEFYRSKLNWGQKDKWDTKLDHEMPLTPPVLTCAENWKSEDLLQDSGKSTATSPGQPGGEDRNSAGSPQHSMIHVTDYSSRSIVGEEGDGI